jgi:hypothetical protein
MKNTKLTCTFYIGGERVEKLTAEQSEVILKRLSTAMSHYYTQHPEEYASLKSVEAPQGG